MFFPKSLDLGGGYWPARLAWARGRKLFLAAFPLLPSAVAPLLDESPRPAALPARSRAFAVRRCGAVRGRAHGRHLLPPAGADLRLSPRTGRAAPRRSARLFWKIGSGRFPTEFGDQMYYSFFLFFFKKSESGNSYQADSIFRLCSAWVKWD